MKRLLLLLITIFFVFSAKGQDREFESALNHIRKGYCLYGMNELKKCADNSHIWAQYFLGRCYEEGYIVEQNKVEAFRLYRKTAEMGLAVGQKSVANCYRNGIGTEVNVAKAAQWDKKAQGNYDEEDIAFIGRIYNEGIKNVGNYAMNPNGGAVDSYGYAVNSNNNQVVNNITIVQATATQTVQNNQPAVPASQPKSDVDLNIPQQTHKNENTFAVVLANENYHDVAKVPNALNDGEMFAEYCRKTLGLPESNVHLVKDATLNNMKREINWMKQTAEAYKGAAKIIVYYAGHGIPDEATKNAFLLPVDGFGTDVSTGYSLSELYATLGKLPAEQVLVLLDACFSGTQRGEGMLASARGVAIKAKPTTPTGQVVVLSAAQGDETAYPYNEQNHGLFTYYLLKKLQETKGSVSLGELSSYVKDEVSKKSIVVNGKSQTPSVSASAVVGDNWKNWTLK